MPNVVVLHGPSLSLLGVREPTIYGTTSLAEVDASIVADARALGVEVRCRQTNHEGVLIDELLALAQEPQLIGVVLNAGAWSHTSLAVADAVRAIAPVRVIEVHLSNTAAREPIRQQALVGAACAARVEGLGALGYRLALRALVEMHRTEAR